MSYMRGSDLSPALQRLALETLAPKFKAELDEGGWLRSHGFRVTADGSRFHKNSGAEFLGPDLGLPALVMTKPPRGVTVWEGTDREVVRVQRSMTDVEVVAGGIRYHFHPDEAREFALALKVVADEADAEREAEEQSAAIRKHGHLQLTQT